MIGQACACASLLAFGLHTLGWVDARLFGWTCVVAALVWGVSLAWRR